jgi:hypothetical protein
MHLESNIEEREIIMTEDSQALNRFLDLRGLLLVSLELRSMVLTEVQFQALSNSCPNLVNLNLTIEHADPMSIMNPIFGGTPFKLKRLRTLAMSRVIVSEEDVQELLEGRSKLRKITLEECQILITPQSLVSQFQGFGCLHPKRRLSVGIDCPLKSSLGTWLLEEGTHSLINELTSGFEGDFLFSFPSFHFDEDVDSDHDWMTDSD